MENLTKYEEEQYNYASTCHICSTPLISEENTRVQYNGNAVYIKCKQSNQSLYLNKNQFKDYKSQKLCIICNQRLPLYGDERVRDHCHVTGKFRWAAH